MANFKLLEDSKSKEDNYPFLHSIEHTKTTKANPRCIKTHLAWDLLPKAIQNKEKRPKVQIIFFVNENNLHLQF